MKAYVFPGQGAQTKGMGASLFDEYTEEIAKADKILGYSIKDLCLTDPQNQLGQTQFTQPALFVVSALTYLKSIQETGQQPDFMAGHSVGEYAALFAAGVFDFETGLKIVKYRGQLMSEAKGGGMAAVIGLNAQQVEDTLRDNALNSIDVANYNSLTQIVISGMKADIESAKSIFEGAGAMMYIPLQVSGAFHSRYMKEAGDKFKGFIEGFSFSAPQIDIIANVDARPYTQETVMDNLQKQIISSVRWVDSVQYMLNKEVTEFEELGPGKVLAGLIQRIKRGS